MQHGSPLNEARQYSQRSTADLSTKHSRCFLRKNALPDCNNMTWGHHPINVSCSPAFQPALTVVLSEWCTQQICIFLRPLEPTVRSHFIFISFNLLFYGFNLLQRTSCEGSIFNLNSIGIKLKHLVNSLFYIKTNFPNVQLYEDPTKVLAIRIHFFLTQALKSIKDSLEGHAKVSLSGSPPTGAHLVKLNVPLRAKI